MFRIYISIVGLAILSGCAGGGGGGGSGASSNTLTYTSASAFETSEYSAQTGLALAKASSMYYNGHYRWYAQNGGTGGNPSESTAGTGTNIKVAVNDTGISHTALSSFMGSSVGYDYVTSTAGVSADGNGHGTHVAGIIAAPKDGTEMHGIAYNSTLVPFRIFNNAGNWVMNDALQANMILRAEAAGAYINNNSWATTGVQITAFNATTLRASNPLFIAQLETYVANGGVVVFATGNQSYANPSPEAGAAALITSLRAGWLAVTAVDAAGTIAAYANRCGTASAFCLAAQGSSVYSTYTSNTYANLNGTSMAAPQVSGAIAGLKSMFPNLSYQDIAARLLTTANRTGIYASSAIYGQGLMDLESASNPVGGVSLPTGAHTSGSSGSTSSSITLPSSMASSMRNSKILLVDNYQKAPFWVPASSFVQESKIQSDFATRHMSSMSEPMPVNIGDEEGTKYSHLRGLHSSVGFSQLGHAVAFSSGIRSDQSLIKQLNLHYLPHLNDSSTNTNGFGYATNFGKTKIAMMGSMPNSQSAYNPNELTQTRSMMGSRTAYSFVSQREHENFAYGLTYSQANSFTQPLGIMATGAFGLSNGQSSSLGSFYSHSLFSGMTKVRAGVEMASFNAGSTGLTSFDSGKYAVLRIGADHFLSKQTTLSVGFKQDQAMSGQLNTKLPSTIDSNGNIGYQNYSSGFSNFINSSQVNFDIHHRFNAASRIKGGLMYEQRPYGLNGAGAALFYEHRL
jgi:subtilisin family serine protease